MPEIIDLSQEIYPGMPVYESLPQVKMSVHNTHEKWAGIADPKTETPAVYKLELGEHTGTHVDAFNHMKQELREQSIDKMPLAMFYTRGICLDLSDKGLRELIDIADLQKALANAKTTIQSGDTVLLYTDHFRRTFGSEDWKNGPGITTDAARWLGEKQIAAFGVETMSPGVPGISNKEVHQICGDMSFTHYENMINLHELIGRGSFQFIALPLKIRGGTGSPVRAVAVFE